MKSMFIVFSLILPSFVLAQTSHTDKKVSVIHSGDSRGCFFFKLEGVSEADPINKDISWFAFSFDEVSSDSALSILMAAKASSGLVNVNTSGEQICGSFAEVKNVIWVDG